MKADDKEANNAAAPSQQDTKTAANDITGKATSDSAAEAVTEEATRAKACIKLQSIFRASIAKNRVMKILDKLIAELEEYLLRIQQEKDNKKQ